MKFKWSDHGTNASYQRGCRCMRCKSAHNYAVNGYRTGRLRRRPKIVDGESTERVERMMRLVDSLYAKRRAA